MSRRNAVIAVLAVALLIGGAIMAATQDDRFDEEPEVGGGGPAVTETLIAVQDCPYGEASCILGQGIERALRRGNVDAVMQFGTPRFYICPGPGRSGAPSPLCDRVGADEGRLGYPVARRGGTASVVAPETLQAMLQAFVDAVDAEAEDGVVAEAETAVLFETGGRLDDLGEVDVIDQSLPR